MDVSSRPCNAASEGAVPQDAEPTDAEWAPVWRQMLGARQSDGSFEPGSEGGTLTAAAAALADLYRPLLRARQRACAPRGGPTGSTEHAAVPSASATAAGPAASLWVIGQLGQSLDGCVATAAGDSYFVTGELSLLHLHRLRALCDAVLVGAGTVAADDPQLTTRRVPGPNPVRVVLDPTARLDGRARVLRDPVAPTLWVCDARHAALARSRIAEGGAEVLALDGLIDPAQPARGPDIPRVLQALAARGLRLLLVEGGGVTVSRFLAAGALDRLHLVVAPVLIGDGRRGIQGAGPARMADCPRPPAQRRVMGEDVLFDLDLGRR